MKHFLLILFLSLIRVSAVYAPESYNVNTVPLKNTANEGQTGRFQPLWEAVCTVESNNNESALNGLEMAFGIAQIRDIRIRDYNDRTGKGYTLEDCLDSVISREVFMYYAERLEDYETIAKRWNGSGAKTEIYWEKIKEELNKTNN
jgi:hypothetical protein